MCLILQLPTRVSHNVSKAAGQIVFVNSASGHSSRSVSGLESWRPSNGATMIETPMPADANGQYGIGCDPATVSGADLVPDISQTICHRRPTIQDVHAQPNRRHDLDFESSLVTADHEHRTSIMSVLQTQTQESQGQARLERLDHEPYIGKSAEVEQTDEIAPTTLQQQHQPSHGSEASTVTTRHEGLDIGLSSIDKPCLKRKQSDEVLPSLTRDKYTKLNEARVDTGLDTQLLANDGSHIPRNLDPVLETLNEQGPAPLGEGFSGQRPQAKLFNQSDGMILDTGKLAGWETRLDGLPSQFKQIQLQRPGLSNRTMSTPITTRRTQSPRKHAKSHVPITLHQRRSFQNLEANDMNKSKNATSMVEETSRSLLAQALPLPPLSLALHLQLELSSDRPSSEYVRIPAAAAFPYESSKVKIERLVNFLSLPLYLEGVLCFGTLACFDAWLYTFTILPLRMVKSIAILARSWSVNLAAEVQYLSNFVYFGSGRMWRRRRTRAPSTPEPVGSSVDTSVANPRTPDVKDRHHEKRHRRAKSVPSSLSPVEKADILRGLLILLTCLVLLRLDASRMYHWIRIQSTVKLYFLFNLLEQCDRLFSAIGQDILECLFSKEALERKPDGHSKILRPLWLFLLALLYTTIHSTALFYQLITLNVAVNSYSNALITLLMSNQFVEIKSAVFKKFEKESLFQLTCADVVERFQLWLMLIIIASRNIIETGGLSWSLSAIGLPSVQGDISMQMDPSQATFMAQYLVEPAQNLIHTALSLGPALGSILAPFLAVLGSEMLVDWLKHAYINKFNNTRPLIYSRFLDVLSKDYYIHAFADQNLTKRLGLPLIPLSCLFIRASVQTYHMFVAAWSSTSTSNSAATLASIHDHFSTSSTSLPTSSAVVLSQKVDMFLRHVPSAITQSIIFTHLTTILVVLLVFLLLLAFKLLLGMGLLTFARFRYLSMKERERSASYRVEGGKRIGGWGVVEVDDDKRRGFYEGDTAGLEDLKARRERAKSKSDEVAPDNFDKISRYEMGARSKRIW